MHSWTRNAFLLVALVVVGALLGAPSAASASALDWFGYDARSLGAGGGGGGVAVSDGVGALHGNPALLADVRPGISLSYVFYRPSLSVRLEPRPLGADIPRTYYDARIPGTGARDKPLPTEELAQPRADSDVSTARHSLVLGLVVVPWLDELRLGLLLRAPVPELADMRFHYSDEREQYFSNRLHFARFGEWDDMMQLGAGLAWRPLRWLSVGLSVDVGFLLSARTRTYIPEASVQDYGLSNAALEMEVRARPVVGVAIRPVDWLQIGVTYRAASAVRTDVSAGLQLWNYHEAPSVAGGDDGELKRISQEFELVTLYRPHEIAFGVAAQWDSAFVEAAATVALWSGFEDEHGAGGRFRDVVSATAGAGWQYLSWSEALVGVAYSPSPVPPQTGATNYADGDVVGLTAGHRFRFSCLGASCQVGVFLQGWWMLDQIVHKDPARITDEFPDGVVTLLDGAPMPEADGLQTNNPGFPGYQSGGWTLVGGGSLRVEF